MEVQPLGDFIYVELEREEENKIKLGNGQELWLDTSYERYHNARQYGIVKLACVNIKKRVDDGITIKKGDKVYFHHFCIDERMSDDFCGENIYKVHHDQIYCIVRNGKIIMTQDYVFVEPVNTEDKIKGFYMQSKESTKEGIVANTNQFSKEDGFKVGDKIMFIKDANYDMVIEGKRLFRMKNSEILCKIK